MWPLIYRGSERAGKGPQGRTPRWQPQGQASLSPQGTWLDLILTPPCHPAWQKQGYECWILRQQMRGLLTLRQDRGLWLGITQLTCLSVNYERLCYTQLGETGGEAREKLRLSSLEKLPYALRWGKKISWNNTDLCQGGYKDVSGSVLRSERVRISVGWCVGKASGGGGMCLEPWRTTGLGLVEIKGKGTWESGCGWGLGHVGADCPGSWTILSILGFRKEGALNKSQTWLSQMS